MDSAIQIEDLFKQYTAPLFKLEIPQLKIPKGYITGIIGKNGAGKSTLINILSKNNNDYTGNVFIFDKNIKDLDYSKFKKSVSFCFEDFYYPLDWSLEKTKTFVADFYDNFDSELFYKLLDDFSIKNVKKLKTMSKGEKKKFELALSLARSSDLLILDEPNSGVDPISRRQIVEKLNDFICESDDKTILFSSHIIEDIEQIADFIIFIDNGKIIGFGEKEILKASFMKLIIKGEIKSELKEKILKLSHTNNKTKTSYIISKADFCDEMNNAEIIVGKVSLLDIYEFQINDINL